MPDERKVVVCVATEWASSKGGISTFNRKLCREFSRAGFRVVCVVPRLDSSAKLEQDITLLECEQIPGAEEASLLMLPPKFGTYECPSPDLVVGHGHVTGPAALALSRRYKSPFLFVIHTSPEDIEPHKERDEDSGVRMDRREEVDGLLCRAATLVAAVGPVLHYYARRLFLENEIPLEPLAILPFLSASKVSSGPPHQPRFLVVGRMEDGELKGLDIAAAAMGIVARRLESKHPAMELVVRGVPPGLCQSTESRLRDIARSTSSEEVLPEGTPAGSLSNLKIVARPYTSDETRVARDIVGSTAVLMPSRSEGYGLVALESIMAGVPALVSDRSGVARHLATLDEDTTLVVGTDSSLSQSARSWADAIGRLLDNEQGARCEAKNFRSAMLKADYGKAAIAAIVSALKLGEDGIAATSEAQSAVGDATRFMGDALNSPALRDAVKALPPDLILQTRAILSGTLAAGFDGRQYSARLKAYASDKARS